MTEVEGNTVNPHRAPLSSSWVDGLARLPRSRDHGDWFVTDQVPDGHRSFPPLTRRYLLKIISHYGDRRGAVARVSHHVGFTQGSTTEFAMLHLLDWVLTKLVSLTGNV